MPSKRKPRAVRYRISGSITLRVHAVREFNLDPLLDVDDDGKPYISERDAVGFHLWDALMEKVRNGDFEECEEDVEVDELVPVVPVRKRKGAKKHG